MLEDEDLQAATLTIRRPVWLALRWGTCYCPNRNQWSRFIPGRVAAGYLPEASRRTL